MPFGMTLDNLDKARDMLAEYTPDKVKDFRPRLFAAGAVRL